MNCPKILKEINWFVTTFFLSDLRLLFTSHFTQSYSFNEPTNDEYHKQNKLYFKQYFVTYNIVDRKIIQIVFFKL